MERLSDTAIEIINGLHTERLEYASEYIPLIDSANRLAAYEDTGLEPEEIKVHEAAKYNAGYYHGDEDRCRWIEKELGPIDHLRDLLQAEKDGRIPPCKRGDVVYCIRHNPCTGYYVKTLTVCTVTIWEPGRFSVFTTKEDELGKTVFLTREEAEAALALKGGEG